MTAREIVRLNFFDPADIAVQDFEVDAMIDLDRSLEIEAAYGPTR